MGARGAFAGAHTALPSFFWPRLQVPGLSGGRMAMQTPNTWCGERARPRSPGPSGSLLTASHASRSAAEGRRRQRRPDRPSLHPAPPLPGEKHPPPPGPESCAASPPPGSSGARARARRAHAPSRLPPRHLHKQGAKHPRAPAPGTRRPRRAASPQRLARARAHAATRGHTCGPLPPAGSPRPPICTPERPAPRGGRSSRPHRRWGRGAGRSGAGTGGSRAPSPCAAQTDPGPPPLPLGPHTWPRCGVSLAWGPHTLTCPAPLRAGPCASLLRLREPGPPARHISRNRGGGETDEGWLGEGGLRVPSFLWPSAAATNQIKKN